MTETETQELRADIMARLLLIQSTAGHLPNETAILGFVCRGLEMVPGVSCAWHEFSDDPAREQGVHSRFALVLETMAAFTCASARRESSPVMRLMCRTFSA